MQEPGINNNRRHKRVLVTLADAGFISQAKQLFASAYLNSSWDGDYLLITSGLEETDRAWFEKRGIIVYDQPLLASSFLGKKPCPPIHLSKFYLFTDYFQSWQQVFFLDADIIVKRKINKLYSTRRLSAVWGVPQLLSDELSEAGREEFSHGYPLRFRAFSSGVMAFDSSIISQDTFSNLLSFYNKNKENFPFNEESALNFFFYRYRRLVKFSYNAVPWLFEGSFGIKENKLAARVLHFAYAPVKPWEKESPYFSEWESNLRQAETIDFSSPRRAVYSFDSGFFIREFFQTYCQIHWMKIDKQIGRFGLIMKAKCPRFYFFLKRILFKSR